MAELTEPAPLEIKNKPFNESIASLFKNLSARGKMGIMVALPLLIAAIAVSLLWSKQPEYKVLFSGLSDKDGGAILSALATQNIPYKMADSGTAIMVPVGLVHETRLKLASQGLPKGSTAGFELMDGNRLGLTQFQEQVNYQRALEGELSRSIESMEAVQTARVHLAIPKPSVFLRDLNKPTASIVLQLQPGRALDRRQTAGIVHLVSSSVPGLIPSAVSVVDQNGTLLSGTNENNLNGLDANQVQYLQVIEQQYVKRITELLGPIVGAGNIRAQVAVDIDFSQSEQTEESFKPNGTPESAAIRSQQKAESNQTNNLPAVGIPGSLSNTPPGSASAPITGNASTNPDSASTSNNNLSTQRSSTTNYEVDKTVRYVKEPVGRVKRVAAAVAVNYRQTTVEGKASATAIPKEEMDQIESLVKQAVGMDADRKDSVSVINIPFNNADNHSNGELPLWKQPEMIKLAKDALGGVFVGLIILYLLFGLIKPAIKEIIQKQKIDQVEEDMPKEKQEIETEQSTTEQNTTEQNTTETEQNTTEVLDEVDLQKLHENALLEQARQLVRENPRIVANIIKNWVANNE